MDARQRHYYEKMLARTRQDYQAIQKQMAEELEKTKRRITELRGEMDAILDIYADLCAKLGVKNDLADDE
jgi:hypothetical protein